MTATDIHIALEKQEMKRVKLKRCALCSRDKEVIIPQVMKINQETLNKLKEVATKDTNLTIVNAVEYIPEIDGTIDDLTLKPIDGMGYQVSFRMCQECLHRMAWKHKYKSKHIFATA